MLLIHATCVALAGRGVLLRGPSGAGKSDLALRLIDGGARLVADDQVVVSRAGTRLHGAPPARLRGLLEVRGLGVMQLDHLPSAPLDLAVDLVALVARLPERLRAEVAGCELPLIRLAPFEASAPAKLRLALDALARGAEISEGHG